jgi:hypothetical protein
VSFSTGGLLHACGRIVVLRDAYHYGGHYTNVADRGNSEEIQAIPPGDRDRRQVASQARIILIADLFVSRRALLYIEKGEISVSPTEMPDDY